MLFIFILLFGFSRSFWYFVIKTVLVDGLNQTFFRKDPFEGNRKTIAPLTKFLKKLPLKKSKTIFFALHHQLNNI